MNYIRLIIIFVIVIGVLLNIPVVYAMFEENSDNESQVVVVPPSSPLE